MTAELAQVATAAPCLCPAPGPRRACGCSPPCWCHQVPRTAAPAPSQANRRAERAALKRTVRATARAARVEIEARRGAVESIAWSLAGDRPEDDGGSTCAWCEGRIRRAWMGDGLCDRCSELSGAIGTERTRRRMLVKLSWRARRGELDLATYSGALFAHRSSR